MLELGCDEISIADTIGAAHPDDVDRLLDVVLPQISRDQLALHFHDTSGQALANVDAALRWGVTTFDSSAGGMGGCPYAPGAPGNLGTETLATHLAERAVATGIDVEGVRRAVAALTRG